MPFRGAFLPWARRMNALPTSILPRTISTVILWLAIIVAYIIRSEAAFALLIALPILVSLWEYFALLKAGGIAHHRAIGMGAAIVLIGLNFWMLHSSDLLERCSIFPAEAAVFALLIIVLFLRECGRDAPGRPSADAITFSLFGVVYIPWLFLFMAKLLYLTPRDAQGYTTGQYLVLFVVAVTKFTDVGAFLCAGSTGKR